MLSSDGRTAIWRDGHCALSSGFWWKHYQSVMCRGQRESKRLAGWKRTRAEHVPVSVGRDDGDTELRVEDERSGRLALLNDWRQWCVCFYGVAFLRVHMYVCSGIRKMCLIVENFSTTNNNWWCWNSTEVKIVDLINKMIRKCGWWLAVLFKYQFLCLFTTVFLGNGFSLAFGAVCSDKHRKFTTEQKTF